MASRIFDKLPVMTALVVQGSPPLFPSSFPSPSAIFQTGTDFCRHLGSRIAPQRATPAVTINDCYEKCYNVLVKQICPARPDRRFAANLQTLAAAEWCRHIYCRVRFRCFLFPDLQSSRRSLSSDQPVANAITRTTRHRSYKRLSRMLACPGGARFQQSDSEGECQAVHEIDG